MLTFLLAAVIAQPLASARIDDARLAVSFPADWDRKPPTAETVRLALANKQGDGAIVVESHPDSALVRAHSLADRWDQDFKRLVTDGEWQRFAPPGITKQNAYQREVLGRVCVVVEYEATGYQMPVGMVACFLSERRMVVVKMGTRGPQAAERFAQLRPLFVSILDGMSPAEPERPPLARNDALGEIGAFVVGVGAVGALIVCGGVWFVRHRRKSLRPMAARKRRR
jgi:hypothetical protein